MPLPDQDFRSTPTAWVSGRIDGVERLLGGEGRGGEAYGAKVERRGGASLSAS